MKKVIVTLCILAITTTCLALPNEAFKRKDLGTGKFFIKNSSGSKEVEVSEAEFNKIKQKNKNVSARKALQTLKNKTFMNRMNIDQLILDVSSLKKRIKKLEIVVKGAHASSNLTVSSVIATK